MADVATMSITDKLEQAMLRSKPYVSPEIWAQVSAFFQPESLAIMAGVTTAWAVSHFFGVGEIADGVLLGSAGALLGLSAVDVGREVLGFALGATNARTTDDLDEAGKHFAAALIRGGITVLSALFFLKRPQPFQKRYFPVDVEVASPGPRIGRVFYEPTVSFGPIRDRPGMYTSAITDEFGNITINITLPAEQVAKVMRHEMGHRWLTPKFYFLRGVRVRLALEGYNRSYLLRYLEEALVQTNAEIRESGLGSALQGITFPVKGQYVTVAAMATEAMGIFGGTVMSGGTTYRVFANLTAPRRARDPGQRRRR